MIARREINLYKGIFIDILKLTLKNEVIKGKYIDLFEKKFAEFIGIKYAIATFSGRHGLELILRSFYLNKKDEVLVPAYTYWEIIRIIKNLDLQPVLIDINLNSFNMDTSLIKKNITKKTKVILATHMFGMPCNIEEIIHIAKMDNLRVIEDCAHAHGAMYKNSKVGTFADAAFFSFDMLKPINTFGGGMITTNSKEIHDFIRKNLKIFSVPYYMLFKKIFIGLLENFLLTIPPFYYFPFLMCIPVIKTKLTYFYKRIQKSEYTYSYSNLQAFIGLKQLDNLDKDNRKRNENASLIKSLLDNKFIFQKSLPETYPTYYQFVILTKAKKINLLRRKIFMKGIDCAIREEILDDCSLIENVSNCPNSRYCFNNFIQIPIYKSLKKKEIYYIASVLNKFIENFYE